MMTRMIHQRCNENPQ